MTFAVSPSATFPLPALGAGAVVTKPTTFKDLDLPAELTMADMMSWLSLRMKDSDTEIRAQMASVNTRKGQQQELGHIIQALRDSKSNPAASDGKIPLGAPLDDPNAIRDSDWYKSIPSDDRTSLDKLLDSIQGGYEVTTSGPMGAEFKTYVDAGDPASLKALPSVTSVKGMPARISKDKFEDAILSLGDMAKGLSGRDEMDMIKLQSSIAARGQLLQMVSNIVASFNTTAGQIVGNMGR